MRIATVWGPRHAVFACWGGGVKPVDRIPLTTPPSWREGLILEHSSDQLAHRRRRTPTPPQVPCPGGAR
jgi:hypothetical protein